MEEIKNPAIENQKQDGLITVTDTYLVNMQKRLNGMIPDLHITDIETMKKFVAFYDWLNPKKVREEFTKLVSEPVKGCE